MANVKPDATGYIYSLHKIFTENLLNCTYNYDILFMHNMKSIIGEEKLLCSQI